VLQGHAIPTGDSLEGEDHTDALLAGIEDMATRRPVAGQIIAVTSSDRTDANHLARVLMGDARLAGRVMKLANSAHFGMSGRATSLQLAIAVVGFTTVRTLATVSLTDSDPATGTELPDDFWEVGTGLALEASTLAPRFGEYAPDALCVGLLSQVGARFCTTTIRPVIATWSTRPRTSPGVGSRRGVVTGSRAST
jgi:HD-like signal output (HDOD) protein